MLDFAEDLAALQAELPGDVLDSYDFEDQKAYQDATGPTPPPTGNYELKLVKAAIKKDKTTGAYILTGDPKRFPIFAIQSATIVGESNFPAAAESAEPTGGGLGQGKERNIGLLFDVKTEPFLRGNQPASNLIDLLRSYDVARASITSIPQGLETLQDLVNQGATIRVRLDWFAEDWKAREEELKRYGANTAERKAKLSKEAFNGIYDKFKARSMSKFPKRPNGGYDGIWKSPSGSLIEARLQIVKFYASTDTVRLGPDGGTH